MCGGSNAAVVPCLSKSFGDINVVQCLLFRLFSPIFSNMVRFYTELKTKFMLAVEGQVKIRDSVVPMSFGGGELVNVQDQG